MVLQWKTFKISLELETIDTMDSIALVCLIVMETGSNFLFSSWAHSGHLFWNLSEMSNNSETKKDWKKKKSPNNFYFRFLFEFVDHLNGFSLLVSMFQRSATVNEVNLLPNWRREEKKENLREKKHIGKRNGLTILFFVQCNSRVFLFSVFR